jgi:hypothetical protein
VIQQGFAKFRYQYGNQSDWSGNYGGFAWHAKWLDCIILASHSMTMHLSHLQIAEPRHLLYAGVPKASSPRNRNGWILFFGYPVDTAICSEQVDTYNPMSARIFV